MLFAEWVAEDGKAVEVDAAGNSLAVYAEGTPYYLLGSHLDTVASGGRFDGAVGVVAGIEIARMLGGLGCGVRVAAFAGEEGARFGRPTLGSAAAAGLVTADDAARLHDVDAVTLASAAAALGLDPTAVQPWIDDRIVCFVEIHIEQARRLQEAHVRVGLVKAIAGSVRIDVEVRGRADHSGATPMNMRLDALAAASELVLAVEAAAGRGRSTVGTVGKLVVAPNSPTTVPEYVRLWVDIRDVDAGVQRSTADQVLERAAEIAEARQVSIAAEVVSEQSPVVLDRWLRSLARAECARLGLTYRVLHSGAGHDAALIAQRAPAMMVFVPCVEGISHAPQELASPSDIAAAASLVAAILRRADELRRRGRRRPGSR